MNDNIKLIDIARQANVSLATVSNVINGTRPVSKKLQEKVNKALNELNYKPNRVSHHKSRNSTKSIGVIVTSLRRIFFPEVLYGIQKNAYKHGYNILIDTSEDSIEREVNIVKMFTDNKVEGIIIHSLAEENSSYLSSLSNYVRYNKRISIVSMERNLVKNNIDSVYVNNYLGGCLAIEHLINMGARKIAFLRGPKNSQVANDRYNAYCDIMIKNNLPLEENMVYTGDFSPLSGYRLARRLLLNGIRPDAIFACNDQMAIGAIHAIKEFGLVIPNDIKVVGFDNTFVSSIITPQLTTINVPKYRMGEEAFSLLLNKMNENDNTDNNKEKSAVGIELPIDLIVRNSTNPNIQASAWTLEDW